MKKFYVLLFLCLTLVSYSQVKETTQITTSQYEYLGLNVPEFYEKIITNLDTQTSNYKLVPGDEVITFFYNSENSDMSVIATIINDHIALYSETYYDVDGIPYLTYVECYTTEGIPIKYTKSLKSETAANE